MALHSSSGVSSSVQWSIYAGVFLFFCGVVTAFLLDDLLTVFADVIGLPTAYSLAILASPVLLVGAVVWWAVVERRTAYTYRIGAAAGLLTALFTGVLWTARFVQVWGFELLLVDVVPLLVGIVFVGGAIAGVLAGLPVMYARRRLDSGQAGQSSPV